MDVESPVLTIYVRVWACMWRRVLAVSTVIGSYLEYFAQLSSPLSNKYDARWTRREIFKTQLLSRAL
jgi:hypothetical protein